MKTDDVEIIRGQEFVLKTRLHLPVGVFANWRYLQEL